jgi:hypothetical protein
MLKFLGSAGGIMSLLGPVIVLLPLKAGF